MVILMSKSIFLICRVFVRCDFDVPLKNGKITDDNRIRSSLATIKYLSNKGAKVILASHLGNPRGAGYEPKYSLVPVAARLSTLLNKTVSLVPDCIGISVGRAVSEMRAGDVVLLENVRFYAEDEKNDAEFANSLAAHVDVFVSDALSTTSQNQSSASTVGIIKSLRAALKPTVSGLQLHKEIAYLQRALLTPERPFAAIVGGSKLSTKVELIDAMLSRKVDKFVLSGGMVFTFLKAQGTSVGGVSLEHDMLDAARRLLQKAADNKIQLLLPSDFVVAEKIAGNATRKVVGAHEIAADWMGLDIGPKTLSEMKSLLADCKTVVWSGTPGECEIDAFEHGINTVADTLAELTKQGCVTIVAGDDTVAAVETVGLTANMTHVSAGRAAAMQLLQGGPMSGIAALDDK